ncbi:MAG: hypothetical protein HFH94_18065 [Lachnospiraceae bacterium]|nr:hypothetical protein [Lachnospiraceae bacterium]
MQSIQGKGAGKTKEQIEYIIEQEFILEHNKAYGQIIREERSKRKLSLEDLSCGIMSRTALEKVEKGKAQWTKLAGDTLMLRMGILPEHFESLSSGEDLDRWRLREDICLLVPDEREQAVAKIQEYRETYGKREPLEEQFLLKAEVVLMLLQNMAESGEAWRRDGRACPRVHMESAAEAGSRIPVKNGTAARVVLEKARQALECTVRPGWEQQIGKLVLSPGELEAVLLVSAVLLAGGGEAKEAQEAQAWALWQAVWEYPGSHGRGRQDADPAPGCRFRHQTGLRIRQILGHAGSYGDIGGRHGCQRTGSPGTATQEWGALPCAAAAGCPVRDEGNAFWGSGVSTGISGTDQAVSGNVPRDL